MDEADRAEGALSAEARPTAIWDVPVRIFHWALVALFGLAWWTGETHRLDLHHLAGLGVLGLLLFRIYWGFLGGATARFAQFVRGPATVWRYGRRLFAAAPGPSVGHNPLGGWSVMAILATLTVMVTTGLFAVDVDGLESGPLADYVSFRQGRWAATVHHYCFELLLCLAALHLAAVLGYLLVFRRNLIRPMLSGGKAEGDAEGGRPAPPAWVAVGGALLAAAATWFVARGLRP